MLRRSLCTLTTHTLTHCATESPAENHTTAVNVCHDRQDRLKNTEQPHNKCICEARQRHACCCASGRRHSGALQYGTDAQADHHHECRLGPCQPVETAPHAAAAVLSASYTTTSCLSHHHKSATHSNSYATHAVPPTHKNLSLLRLSVLWEMQAACWSSCRLPECINE